MNLRILTVFCFILFFSNNLFAQWQTVYQDSSQFQFNTVYFLNNDTGFVGGYNYAATGIHNGIICRTTDGGMTWDTTNLSELIICIQFLNDSFGFCGGDGGANYLTENIGVTWQQRGYSSTMSDHSTIYFVNPSLGYRSTMQSWIQQTTDTGMTWQNVFNTVGGSYFPGTARMVFTDSLTGYLAQTRYTGSPTNTKSISKTTDGGNNWIDLTISANFNPYSCFFFDSLSGWAVGGFGMISKTTDGGLSWTAPVSISNYFLYDIAFVNDSIGYIVGGYNMYDHPTLRKGIIFKTTDSGTSWQVMDSSYFDGLTKMHFPSDSVGYAVGMNGIILKISNANTVFTHVENYYEPEIKLIAYPNPARNNLYLQNSSTEKILVLNLFGNILLEANNNHGLNEIIKLDISTIDSGMYFIKNGSKITKFIVGR